MDTQIGKADTISTKLWSKVPLALFLLAAFILVSTLIL